MAETFTFKILSVCSGGEHINVRVLKDGSALTTKTINKTDIINTELTWHEVLPFLLNKIVANSGATTAAQRKTAIEGASITL